MEIRIGIAGATGYAGAELVRLLVSHPDARITLLSSESSDGELISSIYPGLKGAADMRLEPFDTARACSECDVVFLARGNGWAMEHAAELLENGCRVIDIAADFRLTDPAVWKDYYGVEHTAQELLQEAVYGLPELHADAIRRARLVANPGCYPTSAILALAPAVAGQWVDPSDVVISSASGVSGAGRSRNETPYLFSEMEGNFRAYSVARHRHTPEIEQELSRLAGQEVKVTFTPHLAPMVRGIHTTAYADLADIPDGDAILQAYQDFYSDAPFVHVCQDGELPATKQVTGSNICRIGVTVLARTGKLVVTSVIDNLVKGAAGQAVQNMNLMFGLDQTTGLRAPAVYPLTMPVRFSFEPFDRARIIPGSVTAPRGFSAASWRCGIKPSGREDLALLVSDRPCSAAGVFTTNRVRAACVDINRERLGKGAAQALICNSGNANCCTGEQGWRDALEICRITARELGLPEEMVCGASTGVIGQSLPMELLRRGIPEAARRLSREAGPDFARAIMTTDTVPKEIACEVELAGGPIRIGMAAKGSGMIQPDLATMFCFATTDAAIPPADLRDLLREAVEQSFNCVTVDGDSSTNDMVLVFANGASGVAPGAEDWRALRETFFWMCRQMAMAIAADGEGATKLVEIRVTGAASDADARIAARTIANSPLVKTALFGRDPNWGRILAAAGRSGAEVKQEMLSLAINGREIVRRGHPLELSGEEGLRLLEPEKVDIGLDLGLGRGSARFWTCDLSYDYVRINAEYHT